MTSIKALDKLREKIQLDVNNPWSDLLKGDLLAMCDKVEREVSEQFMPLPCDAEGAPIHTGDLMERCCADDTERFTAWFIAANGDALDDETLFFKPSECRHYKPRTIEDVLREFANEYNSSPDGDTFESLTAKYADEIRELMGVKE